MKQALPETVLLLHSSSSSSRQWRALAEQLQPHYSVHAIDLHGHGHQADWRGDAPLTLADEAALARPLLQAGGVHLIGHSYGGAVALRLALSAPHAVRSLVVYEPVLASWLIDDDARSPAACEFTAVAEFVERALARGDYELAAWTFVDYWGGPGAWASMPPERQRAVAQRMPAVGQHFGALLAERMPPSAVAGLAMPMLVLHGQATRASMRRVTQLLRAAVPQARHESLHGMGHLGPITHAAEVNACIRAFIERRLPAMPLEHAALSIA